jgi:serine protease Do
MKNRIGSPGIALLFLLWMVAFPGAVTGQAPGQQQLIDVARNASPAVVSVTRPGGSGSGVIVSAEGIIITNQHVVGNAAAVVIRLADGREFQGRVLGRDPTIDIAVVRIQADNLPVAPVGDSDQLQVGETAIAIGNPHGLERTVTSGIISAVNRSPRGFALEGLVQTDAAINPGNSGGPLLDLNGNVIGINTAILRSPGEVQPVGLGFAVPVNLAMHVVDQLLTTGRIIRPYMGISAVDIEPPMARQLNLPVNEGVIIIEVEGGSPADEAGLRQRDIITEINGNAITRMSDLRRLLRGMSPGDPVHYRIHREGVVHNVSLILGEVTF